MTAVHRVLWLLLAGGASWQLSATSGAPPVEAQSSPSQTKPRVDAFGDLLPAGARARLGTVRFRQGNIIHALAVSPDGKTIASAGYPSTIHLWDTATGNRIGRLDGSASWIYSLTFLPDGKTLVSAGDDQTILFWDLATQKPIRRLTKAGSRIAIAADGKTMVSADYLSVIRVLDVASGKQIRQWEGPKGTIYVLAFSPDGATVAWGGGDDGNDIHLHIADAATGKDLRRCQAKGSYVRSLTFSPDGKTLASAGNRQPIRFWEVATAKELRQLGELEDYQGAILFAPDGKSLIVGHHDGSLTVWDTGSGKQLRRWRADHTAIAQLATAAHGADGHIVAVAGHAGLVRLWDVHKARELGPVSGKQAQIERWAFSADGMTIDSLCRDGTLRHWDALTGKELRSVPGPVGWYRATFAPGGRELASMGPDGVIRFLQAATGHEIRRLSERVDIDHEMMFSPSGDTLVTGLWGTKLRLHDAASGKERGLLGDGEDRHFQAGAFSPDGKLLVTTHWEIRADDGTGSTIRIPNVNRVGFWTLSNRKKLASIEGRWEWGLLPSISPDGKMLALVETDGEISLWEMATKKERWRSRPAGTKARERDGQLRPFTFSPDGKLMFLGDQSNRLLPRETITGKALPPVVVHDGPIAAVGFSADGKTLAAFGKDGTILLWDAASITRRPGPTVRELSAAELESLWADLAQDDAQRAWKAIGTLVSAPESAVAFLTKHLAPAPPPDLQKIDRMIADLGSEQFQKRAQAVRELEAAAELAEPALRQALKAKPALESARRIETMLAKLEMQILTADILRGLRALEALENIGTPAAARELSRLARGAPASRLTREAQSSLERLAKRPAATEPIEN
jgi:WD40 repeat protein